MQTFKKLLFLLSFDERKQAALLLLMILIMVLQMHVKKLQYLKQLR